MASTPGKKQMNFVTDLEAGSAALTLQGVQGAKSAELLEAAGRSSGELSYYISRFVEQGNWDLIQRISDAFVTLGIPLPLSIRRAYEARSQNIVDDTLDFDSETLECETEADMRPVQTPAWNPVVEQKEAEDILAEVIKTIKQAPNIHRRKIAMSAADWFGAS